MPQVGTGDDASGRLDETDGVYVASFDGGLVKFSGNLGAPLWEHDGVGDTIYSSPAAVNGVVYIGSDQGHLAAYNTGSGDRLWLTTDTGEQVASSPAVANGMVYVGQGNELDVYDAAGVTNCVGSPTTCDPLWTGPTGYIGYSSPAVANGVVYVGSYDDRLYAFDAAGATGCSGTPLTCQPLWTGDTGGPIDSSPSVANGMVYEGSDDGRVYAFAPAPPTISSFTPTSGTGGSQVVITGTNLAGATAVAFNAVSASFTVKSATRIKAWVPCVGISGPISVTSPAGTATSSTGFTVTAPTISSFTPTSGPVGTKMVVRGAGLGCAKAVTFNGAAARYKVNSVSKVTALVPLTATPGPSQ